MRKLKTQPMASNELQQLSARYPANDFVVSRDKSGAAISFYGDLAWDWSPFQVRGRRLVLHFPVLGSESNSIASDALIGEQKWLMYLLIWRKRNAPFSVQTTYHYHMHVRVLAQYCMRNSISISELLGNSDLILNLVVEVGKKSFTRTMASLLRFLGGIGESVVGFPVPGSDLHQQLRQRCLRYFRDEKQYPPLPTRIYCHVISTLKKEIDEFERVENRIYQAIREVTKDRFIGRSTGRQFAIAQAAGIKRPKSETPDEFLVRMGLNEYVDERSITRTTRGLTNTLYGIQNALRLTIQLYTGMRAEEANGLLVGCLRTEVLEDGTHYVVDGSTTKFSHGQERPAQWIASSEAARAIQVAERVALFIAKAAGIKPSAHFKMPLFLTAFYLPLYRGRGEFRSERLLALRTDLGQAPWLRNRLQPAILDEDIRELEMIDPHRAWRSEELFKVGVPWTLTSHQLRRSLALYAQRSGLVSLPSLRRQLQHVTEEMSRYYARGSEFAKQFIGTSKEHFGHEWQQTQPVSSALGYIKNVLSTSDTLFGGHAAWVLNRLPGKTVGGRVNREATISQFKRGEIDYRETALGGCTKVGECDQVLVKWLNVECLKGCKNLVGRLSKLERVVEVQRRLVKSLDQTSLQYQIEAEDLKTLVETYKSVSQGHSSSQGRNR